MKSKHINIALFVPHLGCPHQCSFCNQKSISGCQKQTTGEDVTLAVETALKSRDCKDAEIAFFGGSFTAIDREYMVHLLSAAHKYILSGKVGGIRISTRPDCINREILDTLEFYGVTAIELGCQSMDDEVLSLNKRGHTVQDIIDACTLIRQYDFSLGLQMMTGLFGSDDEKDIKTAEKLISLKPDTVRIYPTVVLENTELCDRYLKGDYKPQDTFDAIKLCTKLLMMFHDADIPVIRLGLHSGGNVEEGFVAGAFHPAFREMCESEMYFSKMMSLLKGVDEKQVTIKVGTRFISQAVGQKRENIRRLSLMGYDVKVVGTQELKKYVAVLE